MTTRSITPLRILAGALALGAMIAPLAGCRGDRSPKPPRQFFPDLDDQQKWKPQTGSEFYADSRTMRPAVPGVVAFGRVSFVPEAPWAESFAQERRDFLKEDRAVYTGTSEPGVYLDRIPVEVTPELIALGREKFTIYCAVCHGLLGDGKGPVGTQWAIPVANFHQDKYRVKSDDATVQLWKDGYIFHVARNGVVSATGVETMPGYAYALSERQAWAVVAYVRALQASQGASLDDVPASERATLEAGRPAPPAAPAVPPAEGGAK